MSTNNISHHDIGIPTGRKILCPTRDLNYYSVVELRIRAFPKFLDSVTFLPQTRVVLSRGLVSCTILLSNESNKLFLLITQLLRTDYYISNYAPFETNYDASTRAGHPIGNNGLSFIMIVITGNMFNVKIGVILWHPTKILLLFSLMNLYTSEGTCINTVVSLQWFRLVYHLSIECPSIKIDVKKKRSDKRRLLELEEFAQECCESQEKRKKHDFVSPEQDITPSSDDMKTLCGY
ncbi:hypothetical protein TSAR_001160 [Trichomalopsis sarcophagae]|uniref:Uncharacterized protein n=1 Tax=Trichomalopsis sarcophagae TaxID=543379 RepID=A0A232EJM7_9HYME|nr:hypothetical protein TSAR_001160 [Trichomalopsis sarcophagae]